MLYYDELFTRSQCLNCRQEIPGLGIECAECHGGNFRLCSECFDVGAEIGQHKKEHRYRFFDSGSLALFPASAAELSSSKENNGNGSTSTNQRWSSREQIRLLDAIEQYGFGNWQDISKHIESRSPSDAKKEFVDRYVDGNIGTISWADRNNNADVTDAEFEFRRNIGIFPQPIDHTIPCDDGPLSPSLTQRLPPLDISSDEMLQLGYMPFRDDYEKEYDNDAEKLVSQLTFSPEDDEVDIGLKLALVDMYSRRLRERARRKRVIRDYQLVSKFFKKDRAKAAASNPDAPGSSSAGKETSKRFQAYEKLLYEKLRPFAQFYNSREFDHMIKNLVKEKDLRFRLQELYKYRTNGITRPEECIDYERSRRGPGKRAAGALGAIDEEGDEDRSHKKAMTTSPALIQQLLQPSTPNSVLQGASVGGAGSNGDSADQNHTQLRFSNGDYNLKNLGSNVLEDALLPPQPMAEGVAQEGEEANSSQPSERLKAGLYTANVIPGVDQLTPDEVNLCKNLNLIPAQYLSIKLAFLVGHLKPSSHQTSDSSSDENENFLACPPEMNKNDWSQLLDYFFPKDNEIKNDNSNNIISQVF